MRSARLDLVTRTGPLAYVRFMVSTLLVLGGVLVGLLVLLALIVSLSAPPTTSRGGSSGRRGSSWVTDTGRPHPDAWSPGTSEMPAVR